MDVNKISDTAAKLTDRCVQLSTDATFLAYLAKTNNIWNNGNYQQIRVVGPMVEAFDSDVPDLYQGILKYLKIGENRSEVINDKSSNYENPDYLRTFGKKIAMNLIPGRSIQFLNRLISSFGREAGLSDKDAMNQVIYRLFYQTYQGVCHEHSIITSYKETFPLLEFKKTTPDMDAEFAVDYLVKKNGTIVAGIQIKPNSYQFPKSQAHKDQILLNKQKNQNFFDTYGVKVAYAFYNDNIAALANVLGAK